MADGNFGGGDGSTDSPYLVEDARDLNEVRNHLDANFEQVADIDLQDLYWEPIGKGIYPQTNDFTGSYDGGGYTISNLFISNTRNIIEGVWEADSLRSINGYSLDGKDRLLAPDGSVLIDPEIMFGGYYQEVIWGVYFIPGPVNEAEISVSWIGAYGMDFTTVPVISYSDEHIEIDTGFGGASNILILNENNMLYFESWYSSEGIHSNPVGLFGNVYTAEFKNINIVNAEISTDCYYLGLLAGLCEETNIKNCTVEGNIKNDNTVIGKAGGLVSDFKKGEITKCCVTAYIEGRNCSGLAAYAENSLIKRCKFEGGIKSDNCSGLVGSSVATYIEECYTNFTAEPVGAGFDRVAGISALATLALDCFSIARFLGTGYKTKASGVAPKVSNCYSVIETNFTGSVIYRTTIDLDTEMSDSYYYDKDINPDNALTSQGRTTVQMKTRAIFVGWDFNNIWGMDPSINSGYPYLRSFYEDDIEDVMNVFAKVDGNWKKAVGVYAKSNGMWNKAIDVFGKAIGWKKSK